MSIVIVVSGKSVIMCGESVSQRQLMAHICLTYGQLLHRCGRHVSQRLLSYATWFEVGPAVCRTGAYAVGNAYA